MIDADFERRSELTTLAGYTARYEALLADFQRGGVPAACNCAWVQVETELTQMGLERRYLTYASFRAASAQARNRKNVNKMKSPRTLLTR